MSPTSTERPLPPRGRLRYSGVWRLYWVRLRRRWPQELLALLGIAVGVALLFASQVASTSLSGPVKALAQGIVGNSQLQVLARSPDGLPDSVSDAVTKLPGVRAAAPMLQVQVNLVGPRGSRGVTLFGADPRVVRLRGYLLQGFTSTDAATQRTLVVPAPIARKIGVQFGDNLRLQIAGRTVSAPVAVISRDQIGALNDTTVALAPLAYLQRLSGLEGRVSRVLVEAEPGRVSAVRAELERLSDGRYEVAAANYETELFNSAASPTSQATTIFSVLSALVGFLFALCAMLVTAAGRRALAVDLQRAGFRRQQIVQVLLVDALVLGCVAVVAGLAFGELLSRGGFGSNVNFLAGAFPLGDERIVSWSSVALAAAGGMLAATLGVLTPLRQYIVPRRAPSQTRVPRGADRPRRLVPALGVACLLIAVVVTVAAPGAAVLGLIVLGISLALLLPSLFRLMLVGLAAASHRTGRGWIPAVELALQQLRAREWRVRSLAIAMTGAVAVFGSISLQGSRINLQDGIFRVAPGLNASADVWVTPKGPGALFGTTPVPPDAAATLRRVAGVSDVTPSRAGFLDLADRRVLVFGPPSTARGILPLDQVLEGNPQRAATLLRHGGWMTISRALAEDLGLRIGDRFVLPAAMPTSFRVAAITNNLGWSGGTIFVNSRDFAHAWQSNDVGIYQVRLDDGLSPAVGRERISRALGPGTALLAETADERVARQQAFIAGGLERLSQIASLTLLAAVLAMATAIAGLLWQHRSVVSRYKLDGHTTGRMWRALFVEAGALVVGGCLAGAVFALLGQVLCTRGLEAVTGFPVVQGVRPGIVVSSFGLVVGASLLVIAIPGYLVARVRPSLRA